jgi:flavodoxin
MKIMVIYDSAYGNTEKIAIKIAEALGSNGEVSIFKLGMGRVERLNGLDLLVVGCPTQRLNMTDAMKAFLSAIPNQELSGAKVAAFDTRLTEAKIKSTPILPFFVKKFGYAAEKIAKELEKKGGQLAVPAIGFYVEDTEGPLVSGELERAEEWAKTL